MSNLAAFLEGLGRVSLQGAVLVLMVLAVQRLLGRQLTPRWRCALWLVVMARLVLPVSVSSVTSVYNMAPRLESHQIIPSAPVASASLAAEESRPVAVNRMIVHNDPAPFSNPPPRAEFPPQPSATTVIPWPAAVLALWLAGVVVLACYIAISSWRLTRRFSALIPSTDCVLLALLEQCREAHGLRGRLLLAESPDVTMPALYGFFQPKLLLPPGFAARFTTSQMRFILLHETAHVKRRDIAFNWLATVLQVVHWFNPLIWLGFGRWRADRELACDAMALDAAGPEQNREYGQTILRLLEGFTPRAAVPGLVGILEDKRQLRRRIAMIAEYVPG
jgi:bla regulator protein BlaR1